MTSLFYAYMKNIKDDSTARYLIVFANRTIADEWWRAVSTSLNTGYATSIQRVTPHFYTHDPSRADGPNSITDATVARQFLGKVMFTLLNDRGGRTLDIIPPGPEITDHISNNWFYVRAKGDSSVYWYCLPATGVTVASRTKSTRFLIRATDTSLDGNVMINSDNITMSLMSGGKVSLSITSQGNLQAVGKPESLRFGDFVGGYAVNGSSGLVVVKPLPENAIIKVSDSSGETWELVTDGRITTTESPRDG